MGKPERAHKEKFVRLQDRGQFTLPAEIRKKYNLKEGDILSVEETDQGILITPQAVLAARLLDQMSAKLRESGVTVEEMLEVGEEIREELFKEMYPDIAQKHGS